MALPLNIKIKEKFREPLQTDVGFVGREAELARLITLFQRRQAATVLVSGHRGVGKSALVEEALKRSRTDKKKRLIARLTLPHDCAKESDIRDQILRSLARSLYFSVKKQKGKKGVPKKLRDYCAELYNKTYLEELHKSNVLESIVEAESRTMTTISTRTTIDLGKIFSIVVGSALSAGVAVGGIALVSWITAVHGGWWGVAAGLLIIVLTILSGMTLSRESKKENTLADKIIKSGEVSETGSYDVSPETLEFELRDLIEQLSKKDFPCVFVIDELDKLEPYTNDTADQFKEHVIFKIVASLKNFFTLGFGVFVFISGEDFYARLSEPSETGPYSLAHTLFTDRIFLHVLYYRDVERLIDQLLDQKPSDDETYHRLRNYLCWQSRNHVFDLLSLIGEYVVFDDKGQPTLHFETSGAQEGHWHEGNLPDNWEVAAALQKFVGAVYDESARPSAGEQRFNQALWLTLLKTANELFEGKTIKVLESGYEVPQTDNWVKNLNENDLDDLAGAVDRLLAKLERYAVVSTAQDVRQSEVEGQPDAPVTSYSLEENPPYPTTLVGSEVEKTPFELSFLNIAGKVKNIANNLSSLNIDYAQFTDDSNVVSELVNGVETIAARKTVPRSKVRVGIKKADILTEQLVEVGVNTTINNWVAANETQVSKSISETESRTGTPWQDSLSEFHDLVAALSEGQIDYYIIGGSTSENQLIIINDRGDRDLTSISDAYSKALTGEKGRERRKQRLPILVISQLPPGEAPEIPNEVVEVIQENEGLSFWQRYFVSPSIKQEKTDLAGWNIFSLDPSLDNLKDLSAQIDEISYIKS